MIKGEFVNITPQHEIKKVLNVGGNKKDIPIPAFFDHWQQDLLDIDPAENPDICCDARELWRLPARQYDAIYCSHNLEHYFWHEVSRVLKGFRLQLKKNGFVLIKVPDILWLMKHVYEKNLDLDSDLYESPLGPIGVLDILYGLRKEIALKDVDFFAHKTGFSPNLLYNIIKEAGFSNVFIRKMPLEITAIAFMDELDVAATTYFNLGSDIEFTWDGI